MKDMTKAEKRKNAILDAANELFEQKGFDGTSTNDILETVGIARGTLYYHFKSKEDIMDALIERYTEQLLKKAKHIGQDRTIPVHERIIRVVMSLNSQGGPSNEVMEHIHQPQNALMHQKIQRAMITVIPPILADIICEGVEQGLFDTPYPYECMEMIVIYTDTIFDTDMIELTGADIMSRIQALMFNIERLLGVEQGSLTHMMTMFDTGGDK